MSWIQTKTKDAVAIMNLVSRSYGGLDSGTDRFLRWPLDQPDRMALDMGNDWHLPGPLYSLPIWQFNRGANLSTGFLLFLCILEKSVHLLVTNAISINHIA